MIGRELVHDTALSRPERLYIRLFGAPINGLRIRARRILPVVRCGGRILDSGCGQGIFTFELARRCPDSDITGMDINRGLVDRNRRIARTTGLDNCRFIHGDLTGDPEENTYDTVLSVDVLEHMEDDRGVLRYYHRTLKDGGRLVLHVPGLERRWPLIGWRTNFDVEGHVRPGYTLEDITGKITRAGFVVEDAYYTYGWLETVTNNISYLITRARMENRHLYALVFPFLLAVSWFGRNARPAKGAGVLVTAVKKGGTDVR